MIEPEVVTEHGQPARFEGDRWVLEEHRRYRIRLPGRGPFRVYFDAMELADPTGDGFLLTLGGQVGHGRLLVQSTRAAGSWPVWVQPRANKLSDDLFLTMLAELEVWLPGVLVGEDATRLGEVGLAGVSLPLLVEALTPLLPRLEAALRAVLAHPRVARHAQQENVRLHVARHVRAETVRWLARNPGAAHWTRPTARRPAGAPPFVPQRLAVDTLDHPANRYLSWLVDRVLRSVRATASTLAQRAARGEAGAWARARAARMRLGHDRLDRLWRRSFLFGLRRQPATDAALLVVTDDALYARAHRLGRRFLSPLFRGSTGEHVDGPRPPTRPSFELYELWCFIAVVRGLQAHPRFEAFRWGAERVDRLLDPDQTGRGAQITGRLDDGTLLRVLYNPRFPSWHNRGESPRVSISTERRPDIVVAGCTVAGQPRSWLALDAKYRVGHRHLGEGFASAHLYRDALRWDRFGGRAKAAMLLTPSASEDCQDWFEHAFRAEHGCGAWELRPGVTDVCDLADWIVDTLAAPATP